jgi:hypothetical protein
MCVVKTSQDPGDTSWYGQVWAHNKWSLNRLKR